MPIAEKVGDLITADHKVLREGCESRNDHRYAVVVQDLATQWIQSYLCKAKTSKKTMKSLQKFLEPTRKPQGIYSDEWITGQKPHLILNGIRIPCNAENFVPIVVPGLSTSSSSSLPSSTSTTPSRQKIDHPTSSSSTSTSPTMTSSTVSSESVARQERGDPCGIDPHPAAVLSKHS